MVNKRWTQEEDAILAKNVKENFDNLQIAFKKTAIEINRTVPSCTYRWYSHFTPSVKSKYGICFTTVSEWKTMINRKNTLLNKSNNRDVISKKGLKSFLYKIVHLLK